MPDPAPSDITRILTAWRQGDPDALSSLTPLVYAELHALARNYLSRERPGHLLQPSALVNEAFLRLIEWQPDKWQDRAHFFGVSATLMRRILVQSAREAQTAKRGDGAIRVSLSEAAELAATQPKDTDVIALDAALDSLEQLNPRQARIIELRFFAGLSLEDTALVLDTSVSTVRRDFRMAQAWLFQQLSPAA